MPGYKGKESSVSHKLNDIAISEPKEVRNNFNSYFVKMTL